MTPKFPKIMKPNSMKMSPSDICGHRVYAEKKYDGTNIGMYLDEDGELEIRSRNHDICMDKKVRESFFKVVDCDRAIAFIKTIKHFTYCENVYVFGELLLAGKSPTKIFHYNEPEFVVFEVMVEYQNGTLFSIPMPTEIKYNRMYNLLWDYGFIPAEMISYKYIEKEKDWTDFLIEIDGYIAEKVKNNVPYEGVVIKVENGLTIIDRAKMKVDKGDSRESKEPLPIDKIMIILETVKQELGQLYFAESVAMPRIIEMVREDAREHGMVVPKGIYKAWVHSIEREQTESE